MEMFSDKIIGKGLVHMTAIGLDGKPLWERTINNLITNDGREQFCNLLMGNVTSRSITQIGFGTSSTATALGDTALTGGFVKAIGSFSFPAQNQILINWTMASGEGNGVTYQEFGLLCANNKLFSRVLSGTVAKTSAFSLVGTWTITF